MVQLPNYCNRIHLLFLGALLFSAISVQAAIHTFNRENTLGTTMAVKMVCSKKEAALEAYQAMLVELDRLNNIFNHRLAQSEIAQLHKHPSGKPLRLSSEMTRVLSLTIKGNKLSRGEYSIFSSQLTQLWKQAEKNQTLPTPEIIQKACHSIAQADRNLRLDIKRRTLASPPELPVDLDSLAKGYIIDRCLAVLMKGVGVTSALVNIGGDIATDGSSHTWQIDIRSPANTEKEEALQLQSGAVATSGSQYRYYTIGGEKYSHLINARSGMPVETSASVTVTSLKAVFADMLATIVSLAPPEKSAQTIDSLSHCASQVIGTDGKKYDSKNWRKNQHSLIATSKRAKKISIAWSQQYAPKTNQKHRHYTIVWIENEEGEKVKDLALWYKSKKSKYLRKFKTWWGLGGTETIANKTLLKTISSASKRKGQYDLVWDHTNQLGEAVAPGIYYIHIEVNREKGPNKESPSSCKVKIDTRLSSLKERGESQTELEDIIIKTL